MKTIACLAAGTAMALAAASSALAGGYQRGQADTDILYEPGQFSTRIGTTYVNPERGFESIEGVDGDYGTYTGTYLIPTLAVKFGGDLFACAGTYTESFAAEADYTGASGGALPAPVGNPFGSRTRTIEFDSEEFGATCRASYASERGRFSLLGGVFFEDFDFAASSNVIAPSGQSAPTPFGPLPVLLPAGLDVNARSDYEAGFRVGAAYEIPEIALRAQILYRSEVTHSSPTGTALAVLGASPFVVAPGLGRINVPSPLPIGAQLPFPTEVRLNDVVSPQSLNVNVQTGIAPGTLLIGSFRWTDWSTNRELLTQVGTNPANSTPFFWEDGYTASIGIGRAFNDNISGLVAVGFDSGVSTGAETTYTDLYTLSGGLSFRSGFGEIRVGGLVGYWTDGEQSVEDGALFNATVGDDWVYAGNAALKITF